ncbi:MAG: DNA modification methylase [Nitrospirae bacterium]|nr:DNA modification methylase [Nitrospirota bacterium]
MKLPLHRWFRYSAGFSSEWAVDVLKEYGERGKSVILDPFAGSGTTLLAAEQAGFKSYGFESHPFVYRAAHAKLFWHSDVKSFLNKTELLLSLASKSIEPLPDNNAPLLVKCYTRETLQRLFSLRTAYANLKKDGESECELLWLAITSIIRSCSFVGTAQWQYVLPNKRKLSAKDPFMAFKQKVLEMASDMRFAQNNGFTKDAEILQFDSRCENNSLKNTIDLVITSPPYPNNYDYADATRLEMTFWGEINGWGDLHNSVRQYIICSCSQHSAYEKLKLDDLLDDDVILPIRSELEATCRELETVRETKGGRKTYHTMIAAYFNDHARVFISLRKMCKKGSKLCYVVGDSAPYGVYVPAEQWLGQLAVASGFESFAFDKIRDRNIKWKNRKHRVPLHEGRLWIMG